MDMPAQRSTTGSRRRWRRQTLLPCHGRRPSCSATCATASAACMAPPPAQWRRVRGLSRFPDEDIPAIATYFANINGAGAWLRGPAVAHAISAALLAPGMSSIPPPGSNARVRVVPL